MDLIGVWNSEWVMAYNELKRPEMIEKGVKLELKHAKKEGFLGLGSTSGKKIVFHNANIAKVGAGVDSFNLSFQMIVAKLTAAYDNCE
jgi:hypothetical protein